MHTGGGGGIQIEDALLKEEHTLYYHKGNVLLSKVKADAIRRYTVKPINKFIKKKLDKVYKLI